MPSRWTTSLAAKLRKECFSLTRLRALASDSEHGQSMVEFALCLPVMLLIVTGITSFGIAMNQYLMLTDSTNSAARQLAISRGLTTDPCSLAAQTVYAAAPLLKQSSLTFTYTLNGTAYSGTTCTSGAASLVQSSTAQVTVTYPCTLTVYGKNLMPTCTLMAQDAELVE